MISEELKQKERIQLSFDDLVILGKNIQYRIQLLNQYQQLNIAEIIELNHLEELFAFCTKRVLKMKLENKQQIGFQLSVAEILIIYNILQKSDQSISYELALIFHQKFTNYKHLLALPNG